MRIIYSQRPGIWLGFLPCSSYMCLRLSQEGTDSYPRSSLLYTATYVNSKHSCISVHPCLKMHNKQDSLSLGLLCTLVHKKGVWSYRLYWSEITVVGSLAIWYMTYVWIVNKISLRLSTPANTLDCASPWCMTWPVCLQKNWSGTFQLCKSCR